MPAPRCHDAAHVVFGCDTSLLDEAAVKIWSLLATPAGLGLPRAYRLPESKEAYEPLQWGDILHTAARSILLVLRVLRRCLRMRKRWPWAEFTQNLDVPLVEIRREFGIDPVINGRPCAGEH